MTAMSWDGDYTRTINGAADAVPGLFDAIDPATEHAIARAPGAGVDQLDSAVVPACHAFPARAALAIGERQQAPAGPLMHHREPRTRLDADLVWINEIRVIAPNRPPAGHKQSSIGVDDGMIDLLGCTVPKTISMRRSHEC